MVGGADRMSLTLGDIAQRLGLELRGSSDLPIEGVCALDPGTPGCLSFLADRKHRSALVKTRAAAVILSAEDARDYGGAALIARRPHPSFARAAALFEQRFPVAAGIHPTAVVHPQASIGVGCAIGAHCVVEAGAVIGEGCELAPGCVVGAQATLGAGTHLGVNVVVEARVQMGARCRVAAGAVIGGRGFGLAWDGDHWEEIPQLGRVIIGNDVEIGANTCIDRGALEDTVIADGVKIDNQVQVGHNNRIGAHTAIAGCTGIAGSNEIGARCLIGGGVGIADHVSIPDGTVITGFSMVAKSLPAPGLYASQVPVVPAVEWRRQLARIRQLDELADRVRQLEKALAVQTTPPTDSKPENQE